MSLFDTPERAITLAIVTCYKFLCMYVCLFVWKKKNPEGVKRCGLGL